MEENIIITRNLLSLEDFQNLQKGDIVACKFKLNIPGYKNCRFKVFEIYENKSHSREIVLEKKNNIYFNYEMFLRGESNLLDILLIQ